MKYCDEVIRGLRPCLPEYKAFQLIGEGGGAVVFSAVHVPTKEVHAIKWYLDLYALAKGQIKSPRGSSLQPTYLDDLQAFDHPNLIKLLERRRHLNCDIVLMEYLRGENLGEYLYRTENNSIRKRVLFKEIRKVFQEVKKGLQHLHEQDLFHADVKPENIQKGRNGQTKLLDYDLVKKQMEDDGYVRGTTLYMMPEAMKASQDAKTDVGQLALVLYYFLTGTTPVQKEIAAGRDGIGVLSILKRIYGRAKLPPNATLENYEEFNDIIVEGVKPNKKDRPPLDELADRIDKAFEKEILFEETRNPVRI
jgi:serine/threonine protein kinase